MIPVTCNICESRVILWDTNTVFLSLYREGAEKTFSATVCNTCLPDSCLREERVTNKLFSQTKIEEPAPFSETEEGSEMRYDKRKAEHPWWKHTGWWIVHNCLSHPLIGLLPLKPFFQFHDWTSRKMHGKD